MKGMLPKNRRMFCTPNNVTCYNTFCKKQQVMLLPPPSAPLQSIVNMLCTIENRAFYI